MYCRNCGSELNEGAKFCENCGTKVNDDVTSAVKNLVKNTADKVKENEFVQSVKQDIENSQSLNVLKDKAKAGFNSAVDKAKEASQNFKSMDSTEKKDSIINGTKKIFGTIRNIQIISVIASILMTLTSFLPIETVFGEALTMKDWLRMTGGEESAFGFLVFLFAITIIWSAIPKKWAAVLGTVNALLPMLFGFAPIIDSLSERAIGIGIGAVFMMPLSVLVFALSIAKLVTLVKAKKQKRVNADTEQPQNPIM